jgi:hypothetical protein
VVKRKLFPRLEADDLIAAHLELNSTLLSAETAMCFDKAFRRTARFVLPAARRNIRRVGTELLQK